MLHVLFVHILRPKGAGGTPLTHCPAPRAPRPAERRAVARRPMPFMRPPPPGFHGAAAAMEKLEPKALVALVNNCVLQATPPDTLLYPMGREELGGLVNGLKFVFRTATKEGVDADDFAAALSEAGVGDARVAALRSVWEKKGSKATAAYSSGALALPQLAAFDWKLGVSMASSDCSSLATGFVTIKLQVRDAEGGLTPHAFELSLAEFDVRPPPSPSALPPPRVLARATFPLLLRHEELLSFWASRCGLMWPDVRQELGPDRAADGGQRHGGLNIPAFE